MLFYHCKTWFCVPSLKEYSPKLFYLTSTEYCAKHHNRCLVQTQIYVCDVENGDFVVWTPKGVHIEMNQCIKMGRHDLNI